MKMLLRPVDVALAAIARGFTAACRARGLIPPS